MPRRAGDAAAQRRIEGGRAETHLPHRRRRAARFPQRPEHARAKDGKGDAQRPGRRELGPAHQIGDEHLRADEDQQQRQRVLEIGEAVQDRGQREIQRPQAKDRKDVRRIDDVGVRRDREHRRHRVDGEDQIRDLDQECGSTCAADFRDRLGVGRKLAIQILEYFDRIGFTRRRGNDHLLRDALLFPEK